MTSMPTFNNWARGYTYYFAGGDSWGQIKMQSISGTDPIILKKCYAGEGTCDQAAGWQTSMGTQQTIIDSLDILVNYGTIDGGTGSGFGTVPYGFKISRTSAQDSQIQLENSASYWTLNHLEITANDTWESNSCDGVNSCNFKSLISYKDYGGVNNIFKNSYVHHIYTARLYSTTGLTIDNVIFDRITGGWEGSEYGHGNAIVMEGETNLTIKNCIFKDINYHSHNTGWIDSLNSGTVSTNTNVYIYNNLFYETTSTEYIPGSNGVFSIINGQGTDGLRIYNNTFYSFNRQEPPRLYAAQAKTGSTAYVKNNLWECLGANCLSAVHDCSCASCACDIDYNFYSTNISHTAETHQQSNGNENFTNAPTAFTLVAGSAAIGNGVNLTAECTGQTGLCVDRAGTARSASAAWDIGAYEYGAGAPATVYMFRIP
jgi:hypothetical protein